jgi:hypothetical protein
MCGKVHNLNRMSGIGGKLCYGLYGVCEASAKFKSKGR